MTPVADPVDLSHRNRPRWDDADPKAFGGDYRQYLLSKVGRVFPGLKEQVALRSASDA